MLKKKILNLLRSDAKLQPAQIATLLCADEAEVAKAIAELENDRIILGYRTVIDQQAVDSSYVEAMIQVKVTPRRGVGFDAIASRIAKFPEVQSVYLMSGGSDLIITVEGKSLTDVASFVSNTISTFEDVRETYTQFLLKKYKKDGLLLIEGEDEQRLAVTP